jgi:hypothetical protein
MFQDQESSHCCGKLLQMDVSAMQPGHCEQLQTMLKSVYNTCMCLIQLASVTDVAELIYTGRGSGSFKGDAEHWISALHSCGPLFTVC